MNAIEHDPQQVQEPWYRRRWVIAVLILSMIALGGFGGYYQFGPCGVQRVERYRADSDALLDAWQDTYALAGNTPRDSLPTPIGELQAIKRDFAALETPVCVQQVSEDFQDGMDEYINALMLFMQDGEDSLIRASIRGGDNQFSQAIVGLVKVSHCAPFCP